MSIKVIDSDAFYKKVRHNPDYYGPFWIIITWWISLFIGMAINSLIYTNFKEVNVSFKLIMDSLQLLMFFGVGTPVILMITMYLFGKKVE